MTTQAEVSPVMNAATSAESVAAVASYRAARAAWLAAAEKADAAFTRLFAKLAAGERTNGAQACRLSNLASYASADLASAQTRLYLRDLDPWDIDDADGVERTPV